MELVLFPRVTPLRVKQPLWEMEQQRRRPNVIEMLQVHIDARAHDTGIRSDRGSDQVGCEFEHGVNIEGGSEPLLRELDPVALDAREADLERVTVWSHGEHGNGLAWRLRRCDHRA